MLRPSLQQTGMQRADRATWRRGFPAGREKSGKPLRELNELGVEGGRGTVPLFNIQLKLNSLESLSLDG